MNHELITPNQPGFTLLELMIAISIIAIISAIGMVTYGQSQKLARDSRRKEDLQQIQKALSLYYQDNRRYPCTGDNTWISSSGGGTWITDPAFASCSDTSQKNLDTNYISGLPKDPLNSGGNPWGSSTGYTYGYRGYVSGFAACTTKNGQFYLLVAQLENKSDPDRNAVRLVKDCDNVTPSTLQGAIWDSAYVLSSD